MVQKQTLVGIAAAVACGLAVGFALRNHAASPKRTDDLVEAVDRDDPALKQSVEEARKTLPLFLAIKDRAPAGTWNFSVKVPIGPATSDREFVWLTPFTIHGDSVSGTIANDTLTAGFKRGETIAVPITDVTDWLYRDGNKVKGAYSSCAIFSHKPKAERDRLIADFGLECDTPG